MTPSPDPQSNRRRFSPDELIAVFVALTSIGAIFFWSISQKQGLEGSFLQSPLVSVTPTTASPSLPPSPSASASVPPPMGAIAAKPDAGSPLPSATPASPAPVSPALQAAPYIAAAPLATASPTPVKSPTAKPKQFTDVPAGYWASASIAALSARGIVDGFPDGSFRPNKPVTRAEFAEMVRRAFKRPASREAVRFNDIKPGYWAIGAIDQATQTRFMSGFPNGSFQPNRQIPRLQALLALAAGLNLQAKQLPKQVLSRYQDAEQIPKYAVEKIAAATEAGLVLNDASPTLLNPNQVTTRAEAAALIDEALQK